MANQRLFLAWMAGMLVLLSACSSAPTASPSPSPSVRASSDACAVQVQAPPSGNIAANFATALAFAPDGRLFWTERSGTVKVWQDGAAHTFATVRPATDGERGLLGLAISP